MEPRLVASLLFVTQRWYVSPLTAAIERASMAAWLQDYDGAFLLAEPLDLSIGAAQIRPTTAMAAAVIVAKSGHPEPMPLPKEYRGLSAVGAGRGYPIAALPSSWVLSPAIVEDLSLPLSAPIPEKRDVVRALLDDPTSIAIAATLLGIYAAQWEAANPACTIRQRPEILATLYQIGFERSVPKPDPRPNAFGTEVRRVYDSPWMAEHFSNAIASVA